MTRQRYSIVESINRILRSLTGKTIPTDAPNTLSGEILSVDGALSDIAEVLEGSLPNETFTLPDFTVTNLTVTETISSEDLIVDDWITARGITSTEIYAGTGTFYSGYGETIIGDGNGSVRIDTGGTLLLTGTATVFDDLRVDALSTRVGNVSPTYETGFRGNANILAANFVHNQADEVQFEVQMPHSWVLGSTIHPHVHFSPWITGTASVQAVRFVMEYYWGNINGAFPTGSSTFTMTHTWTGSNQWNHLLATNPSGIDGTGKTLSSILKCRLYRDNTVSNNLGGKATFLYFDIHFEIDTLGSNQEYVK